MTVVACMGDLLHWLCLFYFFIPRQLLKPYLLPMTKKELSTLTLQESRMKKMIKRNGGLSDLYEILEFQFIKGTFESLKR